MGLQTKECLRFEHSNVLAVGLAELVKLVEQEVMPKRMKEELEGQLCASLRQES